MSKQSSKLVDEIGQFAAIPNEFIESARTMSDPARWLFVLLRYYTNGKTGDAFPSYDELQEMTGWRRTKVSAAIKELVESGWITRQKRFGASTIYRLTRPSEVTQTQTEEAASSSPARTTDEIQKSTRPNYSSSPVRTALVRTGDTLTRLNELDRNNQMESASDATAPTPPASKPSRKKLTHKPTVVQTEPESPRAPSPPVTPEQAAANDAAFAALEAAPPEARGRVSEDSTDPEALAAEIAHECGLDMRVTRQKKAALSAAQEISKAGATVGQVRHEFHHHWRTNVYRGMCGELARPIDLVNEWGRWQHITTPPARPNGAAPRPPLDYDQMLREAQERTANTPPLDPTVFPPIIPAWKILSQSA